MAAPVRMTPIDRAEDYHENSKYRTYAPHLVAGVHTFGTWSEAQPFRRRASKAYPGASVDELPRPRALATSFARLLARRSSKAPQAGPVRRRDLATILWAGQGLRPDGTRNAPSAGGLYPLELYVLTTDVKGVRPGVHHYDPLLHVLEGLESPLTMHDWFLQGELEAAALHIVVTAVLPRLAIKYRERAYRFALQETGHAVQNMLLAATSLGLASCPVGGYRDDIIHDHLGLDGVEEVALSVVTVGR